MYVYENDKIKFVNTPTGRITYRYKEEQLTKQHEYFLTDYLGNTRVVFAKNEETGKAEIIQEDHYYPFGMRISGQHFANTDILNKYLYNGKELQDQTGYLDYGFRQLDVNLGRWFVVDALAESYFSESPYSYAGNNPVKFIDVLGLARTYVSHTIWDDETE